MAGVNKVILIGNLGKDPEVKYLEGGSVVANVVIATTESYKDKTGNKIEMTEWHDLEMWDGLAKIAEQYLKKGKTIYVEGRIKSDTWQDDQGNNRKRTRIRVQNLTMLGSPTGANAQSENPNIETKPENYAQQSGVPFSGRIEPLTQSSMAASSDQEVDDLPF